MHRRYLVWQKLVAQSLFDNIKGIIGSRELPSSSSNASMNDSDNSMSSTDGELMDDVYVTIGKANAVAVELDSTILHRSIAWRRDGSDGLAIEDLSCDDTLSFFRLESTLARNFRYALAVPFWFSEWIKRQNYIRKGEICCCSI